MMLRTREINTPELRAGLELTGSTLKLGETSRGVCPKCYGGKSGEKSFIISRDLGSVCHYNCFRASCGFRGRIVLAYKYKDHTEERHQHYVPFNYPVKPLEQEDVDMFRAVYGISPDRDTFWCPGLDRYAHRVYGPLGQHRGWMVRDYTGTKNPKALAYPFQDLTGPFISWYDPVSSLAEDIIIVEDILSAKKCADSGFRAVALLGTWMDLPRAYEIAAEAKKNPVHLALDEGTMDIMLKYRDKYEVILGDVRIWSLKKDLKYLPRKRIREAIKDGKINFRLDAESEVEP